MCDVSKKVSLKCNVCGNTTFEYDDEKYLSIEETKELKCTVCNKVFSAEELRDSNMYLLENEVESMAEDLMKRELKKLGFRVK